MNNYSDLLATNQQLLLEIELEPVGTPNARVKVNRELIDYPVLSDNIILKYSIDLLDNIDIIVELYNKKYNVDNETAVIIRRISINSIEIIPRFNYLTDYVNDHDNNNPTNYLGFNGKWRLTINQPFYQWFHTQSGQGWLIG